MKPHSLAKLMVVLLFMLLLTSLKYAEATPVSYTYTGTDFTSASGPYTTSENVTVSFTADFGQGSNGSFTYTSSGFTSPSTSAPVPFTMTVGSTALMSSMIPSYYYFMVSGTGTNITSWNIEIISSYTASGPVPGDVSYLISTQGFPGSNYEDQAAIVTLAGPEYASAYADVVSNPLSSPPAVPVGQWSVPEPTTLILVASGLVGLVANRRRKRS